MLDESLPHAAVAPLPRLLPRDGQILEHVARYRLTTGAVVRRLFLSEHRTNAALKITGRLCRWGWLRKFPLWRRRSYFALSTAAGQQLGLPSGRCGPLGPQSLPLEYAVLAYATLAKHPKLRLTPTELHTRFSWLPPSLAQAPHCWDEAGQCLEAIRVDLGGPAAHVARKCLADLRRREQLPEFAALLAARRFRLVIVTAATEKAAAIRRALEQHEFPETLLLHASVVPDLVSLTARHRRGAR